MARPATLALRQCPSEARADHQPPVWPCDSERAIRGGHQHLRATLMVGQVALTLLVGAGRFAVIYVGHKTFSLAHPSMYPNVRFGRRAPPTAYAPSALTVWRQPNVDQFGP